MKHQATCQCGALGISTDRDPDFVAVCNCKACQLRSGSPFGTGAYFPKSAVTIKGDSNTFTRSTDSDRSLTNHFCPSCGTNLFWSLEMRPDHFGISYGCFSTPLPDPARAIWTSQQHGWVSFPENWPQYEGGSPE